MSISAKLAAAKVAKDSGNTEGNAILISRNLVIRLRSELKKRESPFDELVPDNQMVDEVVSEMYQYLKAIPPYYLGKRGETFGYVGTETVAEIQKMDLRDKGKFVEACILFYLMGPSRASEMCAFRRVMHPRHLNDKEVQELKAVTSAIDESKGVESSFCPGTALGDGITKIEISLVD